MPEFLFHEPSKLNGDEQKAVKTAAFDLQLNPAHPALQFHKLDKAKDPHFWAVRVSLDIRLIVHRTGSGLLLCYVNHNERRGRGLYCSCQDRLLPPLWGEASAQNVENRLRPFNAPMADGPPIP